MPLTGYTETRILGLRFGDTSYTPPATDYIGLIIAGPWTPTTTLVLGTYITGSAFATSNRHIYKVTTAGKTGGTEPSWVQTAGGTTVSGGATLTECTTLFAAGSFTNVEPVGNNYARKSVANNTTNWPAPSGTNPATTSNGVALTFNQSTGVWGWVAGFFLSTTATGGNYRAWGLLTSLLDVGSANITPKFPIGSLVVSLT